MRCFEALQMRLDAFTTRYGKAANPVGCCARWFFLGDEVSQTPVRFAVRALLLLAQVVPDHADVLTGIIRVDLDVVTDPVGRE